jgi:transcriptional regulator with XRE-family HTH domain
MEDRTMVTGDRLRQLREAQGKKALDIAMAVGINVAEYQRYESGVDKPNAALLQKIAAALRTTVADLRDEPTRLKAWVIAEGPHDDAGGYTPGVAVVAPDLANARRLAGEVLPSLPKQFKRIDPPREII